ncbi:VOC family protein [Aurantiacibacter rhizosphaerae]|uniref:VOC family protein n=1 Tax=Aurantiacibacter rhizosphaerae TaxID=2691582 RepID=A0A844XE87_9SPHN|nr:VOC family protein [Aurantiacibacter rhizosphaerae]MWV28881.1 VOC family protein [Aurantiacibacter rhizosphaerae]
MYSHMMVGSNDLEKSKTFYDALFTAIGGEPGRIDPKGRVHYVHNGASFLVTKPIDGDAASVANGSTIGFAMESEEQADAWHAAGVKAGGTAIEDPPGLRQMGDVKLYLAYLRDPDGHKLCALKRVA